jgi:hypothetical protein
VQGTKDKPDGEEILDSTFEFELYSKIDAIQMAGDVLGIKAATKVKAEVSIGLADLLLAEVDGTTTGLPSARTTKGKGKVKKS